MQALDLIEILPELALLIVICFILLVTPFFTESQSTDEDVFFTPSGTGASYKLALLTLLGLAVWFATRASDAPQLIMNGLFKVDPLSNILKSVSSLAVFATLVYSQKYLKDRALFRTDYIALALLALLGQFVMISGANLLTLYLGLELLALSTYTLTAMNSSQTKSIEAGMKYFILGALSSGFLLYGMSMIYGVTGSLALNEILGATSDDAVMRLVLGFGLVFLLAGLAFKLGAAPFHMWVPDVYEGAPTAVTLLIGGAPKIAAFALTFRLIVEALQPIQTDWAPIFMFLAVASLLIGNITAIAQINMKRMLAYSTISHMGFLLLGFMSVYDEYAYSASFFYIIVYVLSTLGTFGLLMLLSRKGFECETLDDLKGLNKRSPWLAFMMLLLMFSLAGVPPTVGFIAKLSILEALVDAGYIGLAVIAVIASLIGAFYYLRVIKVMYFDEPVDLSPIEATNFAKGILSINGLFVLVVGIFPATLTALCLSAMRTTLQG
ncbi:MAG: NADH-quinone oxidoreductase subunit NuoN [Betaproteobacteria bacterium]